MAIFRISFLLTKTPQITCCWLVSGEHEKQPTVARTNTRGPRLGPRRSLDSNRYCLASVADGYSQKILPRDDVKTLPNMALDSNQEQHYAHYPKGIRANPTPSAFVAL